MTDQKLLATISILARKRSEHIQEIQKVLSKYAHLVISRMGLNLLHSDWKEDDAGLMMLAVEGQLEEIDKMQEELDAVDLVDCKYTVLTRE